jgi:DNA-binding response OmpR family regulator
VKFLSLSSTWETEPDPIDLVLEVGADEYLTKPLIIDILKGKLESQGLSVSRPEGEL